DRIQALIAAEHRRGLGAGSLRHLLSVCRGFFDFLARDGDLDANPASAVRAPKLRRKLPQVLDVDEVGGWLDFPTDDPAAVRDRGLADGCLRGTRMGARPRSVPAGRRALEALAALREQRAPGPADPLVRGARGRPLTPNGVRERLKRRARDQGVWKRIHPHLL